MSKHFGEEIIAEVLELKKSGYTRKVIGKKYGLSVLQIKDLLSRHRIKQEKLAKGILPKPKGRPRTRNLTPQQKLELENKRLQTENDLLRSFLRAAGRM